MQRKDAKKSVLYQKNSKFSLLYSFQQAFGNEKGSGCGYQTAILSVMIVVKHIFLSFGMIVAMDDIGRVSTAFLFQKTNNKYKTNKDMQKGNIGVTTENIFPVIKKFLYSDHEIFLREMISNAVDATQKMKTLSERGDFKGELGDLTVRVSVDKEAKTITISDRGNGMTEEEIDKYINQIAFSGVNDFLEKYKDNANNIIGHFGLGFYSSFMVSDKVEIITRSYKDGAKAVKWSCDGSPSYEIEGAERDSRGSDIVLHVSDDCSEYLEKATIEGLLNKYCKFMPVPVAFGKKNE